VVARAIRDEKDTFVPTSFEQISWLELLGGAAPNRPGAQGQQVVLDESIYVRRCKVHGDRDYISVDVGGGLGTAMGP
jgi:hypothetical protein